tara:strand:- start:1093 stop:1437 length:345 start_codon:yes stop_codon:yes gene_type:complete
MTRLEITLTGILILSMLFNVGVFVYARSAIVRLLSVSEELGDLNQMVNSFARHLKAVYELDTFYGDQTLSHLLQHAVSFNEQLETFEYIYSLTEDENLEPTDEETDEEEETEET